MDNDEPLQRGQKMFNQRLLAEHCLSESDAKILWNELREAGNDMGSDTFEDSIALCNNILKLAGLEIVGVSIPTPMSEDEDNNNGNEIRSPNSKSPKRRSKKSLVRYYSIINQFPDDIAKKCFEPFFQPQQQAYVRFIFEKLVELGPTSRTIILNYKNDVNQNFGKTTGNNPLSMSQLTQNTQNNNDDDEGIIASKGKIPPLTLPMVEDILDQLVEGKWLVLVNGIMMEQQSQSQTNNKKTRNRVSLSSVTIDIGPRAFLEISYLLVDEFGMEKDNLPQRIYHRI